MTLHHSEELPPKAFLRQVLNHCPVAGLTYIDLWEKKDELNQVYLDKKEISLSIHLNAYKNNLRRLYNEGLISYDDQTDPASIVVELVGWQEFDEIEF